MLVLPAPTAPALESHRCRRRLSGGLGSKVVALLLVLVPTAEAAASASAGGLLPSLTGGQLTLRMLPDAAARAHNAVCLDGTRPGYYFRPGVGTGARKFKIHMSGGGWCQDPMGCYWRAYIAPAVLGSSNNWSRPHPVDNPTMPNPTHDWNIGDFGLLDQDQEKNAEFADWTAVWMRYCDGSSFTSDREEPLIVDPSAFNCSGQPCAGDPKPVWFRGRAIFEALFEDLLTVQGMGTATDVILSGTLAGGVGTYIHAEHIEHAATQHEVCSCA